MDNNNIIAVEENFLQSELAKFNLTDTAISQLEKEYMNLSVINPQDEDGFNKVHQAKMVCVKYRTEIEKTRKKLKQFYLETGRLIDAEAKRITQLLAPIESHLQEQENIVLDEQKRIEEEKKQAEQLRKDNRIKELIGIGLSLNPLTSIWGIEEITVHDTTLQIMTDNEFEDLTDRAKLKAETLRLKKIEEERIAKEEQDRLEKQRQEQETERLRLQKIQEEQAEQARKIKEEQDRLENEKLELKHRQELEEAKVQAAIDAKKKAEEQAERDRIAKLEKERADAIEVERQEKLKPDKEKLMNLYNEIKTMKMPEVKSDEAKKVIAGVKNLLEKVTIYIHNQSQEL